MEKGIPKPPNYWKDFENLKKELLPICEKIDRFPSQKELRILGRSDIVGAFKHHSGATNVAKIIKYKMIEKNDIVTLDGDIVKSYYELLFDNFLCLNNIWHETANRIDIKSEKKYCYDFILKDLKNNQIYVEIWGFGSKDSSDKRCIEYNIKRNKKEIFYKDLNLKLISIEKSDFKKSFQCLYDFFINLCIEYNIKKDGFRTDLDCMNLLVSKVYSFEELHNELKPHIEKLGGYMPTITYFKNNNLSRLVSRLYKFGGFVIVRERLGIESKYVSTKKWTDEYFNEIIINVCEKYKRMPTIKEMESEPNGLSLRLAMTLRGGTTKVAKKFGYKTIQELRNKKHYGYWNKKTYESKLLELCKKYNRMPTKKELKEEKSSNLHKYIKKNGGSYDVAHRLGFLTKEEIKYGHTPGYLNDESVFAEKFSEVYHKYGRMPKQKEILESGIYGLNHSIKNRGGLIKIEKNIEKYLLK